MMLSVSIRKKRPTRNRFLRRRLGLWVSLSVVMLLVLAGGSRLLAQTPLPPPPVDAPKVIPPAAGKPGLRGEDLIKSRGNSGPIQLHTIVIDPGHGGRDTGIQGAGGLLEKDVVLEVARKFSTLLQQKMGVRVILTRSGDFTLPLPERTAIANNAKAQLFISLHLEGDYRRESGGIRVFTLGGSPLLSRPKTPQGAAGNLEAILWDMAQTEYLNESNRLADLMAEALSRTTELPAPAVRDVPLMVLRGAKMPAILVSLAYLTNPKEQSLLDKEEFLEKIATGLLEAVTKFAQGRNDLG